MNKTILGILLGATMALSSFTQAETYEKKEYINILDKEIISIEKAKSLEVYDNDHISELILLGDFYLYNDKYRNTFKAYKYFERATIKGSEYSKMMVGYLTYKGYGVDPNVYKGEYLLSNIKKPYDKNADFLLALNFYHDSLYDKSIKLFTKIKDPLSYTYLSKMLIQERRSDEAIPYLNWLVDEENDRVAKRQLGEIYLSKNHLNEDRAIELLKSSAEDGDDIAQYTLGMYYSKGTKKEIANIQEAVNWFAMSAQHDNAFAIQELLKIWNENQEKNNMYGINNDPYLTKQVNDIFTKMHLNN